MGFRECLYWQIVWIAGKVSMEFKIGDRDDWGGLQEFANKKDGIKLLKRS